MSIWRSPLRAACHSVSKVQASGAILSIYCTYVQLIIQGPSSVRSIGYYKNLKVDKLCSFFNHSLPSKFSICFFKFISYAISPLKHPSPRSRCANDNSRAMKNFSWGQSRMNKVEIFGILDKCNQPFNKILFLLSSKHASFDHLCMVEGRGFHGCQNFIVRVLLAPASPAPGPHSENFFIPSSVCLRAKSWFHGCQNFIVRVLLAPASPAPGACSEISLSLLEDSIVHEETAACQV